MKKFFERSTSQLTVIGRSLLVLTSIIVLSFPLLVIYGSHGSTLLREIRSLTRIIDRTVLMSNNPQLSLDYLQEDMRVIKEYRGAEQSKIDDLLSFYYSLKKDKKGDGERDLGVFSIYSRLRMVQDDIFKNLMGRRRILLVLFIAFSLLVLIDALLAVSYFLQKRNLKRTIDFSNVIGARFMEVLEQDKNMIACELHDDLAQKLAQINLYFQNPEKGNDSLDLLRHYCEEAINQIRMVSNRLKTPRLGDLDPKRAFEILFSEFSVLTGLNLEYSLYGLSSLNINDDFLIHLYRIIQELLNNAAKHSGAEKVSVALLYTHPELLIKYKDDGIGYDPDSTMHKGLGLESIRFRMDYLKAEYLSYDTRGGVDISIRMLVE